MREANPELWRGIVRDIILDPFRSSKDRLAILRNLYFPEPDRETALFFAPLLDDSRIAGEGGVRIADLAAQAVFRALGMFAETQLAGTSGYLRQGR